MFDSGASAAEQQRAAASGAAPDGPLRHVAPGALLALGGTLAALGAGGVFGEGLLANLHKEQPPVPGAAWEVSHACFCSRQRGRCWCKLAEPDSSAPRVVGICA